MSDAERQGEAVGISYRVPDEQRLHYKVTPGQGSLMSAEARA